MDEIKNIPISFQKKYKTKHVCGCTTNEMIQYDLKVAFSSIYDRDGKEERRVVLYYDPKYFGYIPLDQQPEKIFSGRDKTLQACANDLEQKLLLDNN